MIQVANIGGNPASNPNLGFGFGSDNNFFYFWESQAEANANAPMFSNIYSYSEAFYCNNVRGATSSLTSAKLSSIEIQPNSFLKNDVLVFGAFFSKGAGAGTGTCRIGINAIDSIVGITQLGVFTMTTTNLYAPLERKRIIRSATETIGLDHNMNIINDNSNQTTGFTTLNIDWTVKQYLIAYGNVSNITQTLACEGLFLKGGKNGNSK